MQQIHDARAIAGDDVAQFGQQRQATCSIVNSPTKSLS
jgi:hypothetical protein